MIHHTSPRSAARRGRPSFLITGLLLVAISLAVTAGAQTTISTATIAPITLSNSTPANNTLSVTSTGSITLPASSSTVAVTVTKSATITNLGSIVQNGTVPGQGGRAIRDNTGNLTLTINNGSSTNSTALLQTADADVIQMNKAGSTVTLNNYGTINSLNATGGGAQAIDWNALNNLVGTNTLNNFSTGVITANEADAVRTGMNGIVINSGKIKSMTSTGSSSDGIDAQNNTGANITNNASGLIEGGRHGITGGAATSGVSFTTTVTNNAGATIKGDNGSGINLDGFDKFQQAFVINNGLITGNGVTGDGDGIDSDGLITLTNSGTIRSINAFSGVVGSPAQSEGISVGGGTITNSGTIEGLVAAGNLNAVGRGISLLGNDITTGPLAGTREAIYGNATVTNLAGGLIRGDSDSAIAVDGPASGFTVTIDNQAGATLRGGGTVNAALRTGADNDVVTNGGMIDGSSGGKAIDLDGGNDRLTITGGSAVVTGSMNGGSGTDSLTFNLGAATNTFTQNGAITNFEHIQVASGSVQLSGAIDLGAAANTLAVDNGAILNLGASSLTLNQGTVVADGILKFLLNSSSSYGQMFFAAGDLGGLTLSGTSGLDLDFGYTPLVGDQFTLVDFLGDSPFLAGTFAGLAEGATFLQEGYQFQITYQGNGGHDIVVTRTVPDAGATLAFLAGGLGLLALSRRIHGIGLLGK